MKPAVKMTKVTMTAAVMVFLTYSISAQDEAAVRINSRPPTAEELRSIPRKAVNEFNYRTISGVPDYYWSFGCAVTSSSMILGFYSRNGYENLFDIEAPLDNRELGKVKSGKVNSGFLPFAVSENHVNDFWKEYLSNEDPYKGSRQKHSPDCLADYMGTSEYVRCGNLDGGTAYYYSPSGRKLVPTQYNDGLRGMARYIGSRGYSVNEYFTQIVGDNTFTFENFKAEIDAGRPVLVHTDTHTMVGIGYSYNGQKILVNDTFAKGPQELDWAGSYLWYGKHWGCSVVHLDDPGVAPKAGKVIAYTRSMIYIDETMKRKTETATVLMEYFDGACGRVRDITVNAKARHYGVCSAEVTYDFSDAVMSGVTYSPETEVSCFMYGPVQSIDPGDGSTVKIPVSMTGSGYRYTRPDKFVQVVKVTQKLDKKLTAFFAQTGEDIDSAENYIRTQLEQKRISEWK